MIWPINRRRLRRLQTESAHSFYSVVLFTLAPRAAMGGSADNQQCH